MAYIGRNPVSGNFVKLDAITTSATATYNLLNGGVAYFPQTANNCIVSLNGVIQSPTSAYTISGSTIVFSDALTASDSIDFILVLGDVLNIGTPSDATVSFAKVTSNLITGATAETSIAGGDSVLIYDDSAAALRKMTRTNFVSGLGNDEFFLYKVSADQNISNNTTTKVQLATAVISNANFDSTTNYRYTVPSGKAGKYFIGISGNWLTAGDFNNCAVYAYVNGTQKLASNIVQEHYENNYHAKIMDLSVGDYVEMFCRQESGSTIAFRDSGSDSPNGYMMGYKIG